MNTQLILGPPGTGKTTRLLSILEKTFSSGVKPHEVAFLTFTKKAIGEAVDRMADKFDLRKRDLPYFRTIHSICFRDGGYSRGVVMGRPQFDSLTRLTGFSWASNYDMEGPSNEGQAVMAMIELASAKQKPLKTVWEENTNQFDLPWFKVQYLADTYSKFKQQNGFIDFGDILENYQHHGDPLPVKVGIIDEAQDLSTLQWSVVEKFFSNGTRVVHVAGDDDQGIYKWSGADLEHFLHLGEFDHQVLEQSYRLPREILKFSQLIASRIQDRYVKPFNPRDERGRVETLEFHHLDKLLPGEGSWMFLARNRFLLKRYQEMLRLNGIPFTVKDVSSIDSEHSKAIYGWQRLVTGKVPSVDKSTGEAIWKSIRGFKFPRKSQYTLQDFECPTTSWFEVLNNIPLYDREYYRAVLRNGFGLNEAPRFHINTIHGVKGGEADNVVLMSDVSAKTLRGFHEDPDSEHRVFYVGATRARKNLFLIEPQGDNFYEY